MADEEIPTWEEVARQYGRFLFALAYRLTGNSDDAEDLVQEVLIRVRRGLATYRPGSMEGWLSKITTNAFLDEQRRRARRPVSSLDPEAPGGPQAPSAYDALTAHVLDENLQAALSKLPEEFRVPVVLCDVVGLSYAEIAEAVGVPSGTVRSRIHRGRTMLRRELAGGDR